MVDQSNIFSSHTLPGGGGGFLATTPGESRPGIVLAPAIAGVNAYVKSRAKALVDAGYSVFLLDYYAREGGPPDVSTPEKIGAAVASLSDERTLNDMREAAETLSNTANVDSGKIASFGFCIGGMYAYMAACNTTPFCAAVDYYGQIKYSGISDTKPRDPFSMIDELSAPLLAHFGDFDRLISHQDIDDFRNGLRHAQKPFEMFVYSGAPHAFDEDFRAPVYRPVASAQAWDRSLTFLNWQLKREPVR